MNIDKIIQKMHEGIILLEYTSLNSGTQKKREVNNNRKYIPEEKNPFKKGWTQTAESPKIICFDLDVGRWDDIEVSTITSWKEIEGETWKTKQAKLTDLNWDGNS